MRLTSACKGCVVTDILKQVYCVHLEVRVKCGYKAGEIGT